MTHPMDLRELLEARDGRPTEDRAARKIATFAVIPAAMIGLLAGTRLVGIAESIGRLLWVCTATAAASGFSVAFLGVGGAGWGIGARSGTEEYRYKLVHPRIRKKEVRGIGEEA